jgi:hypothetical protein
VELSRLGAVRTQLLAELADARLTQVPAGQALRGIGTPETFPGWVGDTEAQLLLYDDALVVLPARGDAEKLPYPFLHGVTAEGYRVGIEVAGRDPLEVHRLAARTTEFVELLRARHRAAAGRTAAFLGALLPELGALGLRTVAGLVRDGVAAPRAELDRVDAGVWPALTAAVTHPDRVACLSTLDSTGPLWIGVKQVVSVERPAQGVQPWRDPASGADLGDHGSAGGARLPLWLGFGGPFQAYGPTLAYGMLGFGWGSGGFGGSGFGGSGFGHQRPMVGRADVRRGRLTPAHTDLDALTTDGAEPTVLAFALCRTGGGQVVYEALNDNAQDTYVYRDSAVEAVNRALDEVGFRVAEVHGPAGARMRGPGARLLREALAARVAHDGNWAEALGQRLG